MSFAKDPIAFFPVGVVEIASPFILAIYCAVGIYWMCPPQGQMKSIRGGLK